MTDHTTKQIYVNHPAWNIPDLDLMEEQLVKIRNREEVNKSGIYFACRGMICHICKKTMYYLEETNTLMMCSHWMDALKEADAFEPPEPEDDCSGPCEGDFGIKGMMPPDMVGVRVTLADPKILPDL